MLKSKTKEKNANAKCNIQNIDLDPKVCSTIFMWKKYIIVILSKINVLFERLSKTANALKEEFYFANYYCNNGFQCLAWVSL